jgi:hypothetical protein
MITGLGIKLFISSFPGSTKAFLEWGQLLLMGFLKVYLLANVVYYDIH